jgi:hypothetical protein
MPTPKPRFPGSSAVPRKGLTGDAAIAEYQRQISPQGMAQADAAARKALDAKYPGLYVPPARTTAGVKKK